MPGTPQAVPGGSGPARGRRRIPLRRMLAGRSTRLTADAGRHPAGSPFQAGGRVARVLPFAAVAALAEASLALPPGSRSTTALAVSLILLAAVAGAIFLPWDRLPRGAAVAVPLGYLGSVLGLTIASGGTRSGMELTLLIPVVWTALFHRPWESALVVTAFAGAALRISFPGDVPVPTIARRVIFLVALAVMIAVATHLLRAQIRRSEAATARLQGRLRELSIVADRDRIAASLHDTVVQRLFAAGLSLQGIRPRSNQPEVTHRIDAVVANLDDAIKLLRQSIFGLEHGLPPRGLRRGVLDVSSELTPELGTVPEVVLDGPLDTAVPPAVAAPLLAGLRQVLSQLGTGASPCRVAIAVVATEEELSLTVTGSGARWGTRIGGGTPGLGPLRAEARRLGGTCQVSQGGGGDQRLVWRVPLAAVPAAARQAPFIPAPGGPETAAAAAPAAAGEQPEPPPATAPDAA